MTGSPDPAPGEPPFRYVHSNNFPALLEQLGLSLAVTTYQAGKLMVVRARGDRLSLLLRSFERPMGIAVDERCERLVVGTRRMVWTLRSAPEIAPQIEPVGTHDACFVPRSAHVTGDIHGHELALLGDRLWIANTSFSCLCTLDDAAFTFVPQWRPPFVDQLAGEDRCHLNGLAVEGDAVRYVTALGETNTAGGWRENKAAGGVLLEVPSGNVVARGLCMPHSPRVHRGALFVLDSGNGHLCAVDRQSGARSVVAALPGYCRGLAFHGRIAFVGLSQIRESNVFGGLPIAARLGEAERKCGICAVDLQTGTLVAFLYFEAGCAEIFDLRTLPGMRWPSVVGFQDATLDGIMVAPRAAWVKDAKLPLG